jgi:hypothetical protein
MSKLTELTPETIQTARPVRLVLIGKNLVAIQGARIIGKVVWTPREEKQDVPLE